MQQRVSSRAIIRKDDKILLLRRANGREVLVGKYELPGGKLVYGEQPEDTLARYLKDDTALTPQTVQLTNVFTYIDHDDRDIQYTFILYTVSVRGDGGRLKLGPSYDHYVWMTPTELSEDKLTESTKIMLGLLQQSIPPLKKEPISSHDVGMSTNASHAIIYSDGGSRGNPGPSAAGFVIMNRDEVVIQEGGMYLGITTNNLAEYHGVRLGLEKALELGIRFVDFRIDSLLVVNQMNRVYTIKNRELWPVNERIRELVAMFEKVTFTHVKREYNRLADGMVNKILDAQLVV
jgi:ribonuclease HI/ADP-ribose pyrophosphatase YjhB (NUDIX family)